MGEERVVSVKPIQPVTSSSQKPIIVPQTNNNNIYTRFYYMRNSFALKENSVVP